LPNPPREGEERLGLVELELELELEPELKERPG
jgi:hypothetical protein